jgi:CheY-like chemotaxis protein
MRRHEDLPADDRVIAARVQPASIATAWRGVAARLMRANAACLVVVIVVDSGRTTHYLAIRMDARTTPAAEVSTERHPRILVIDDDQYVRMLLGDLLTAWGYDADVVGDGTEGLALFGRGRYDAVLTDLAMSNVSGLDIAAGVRTRNPSIAVILFTASSGGLDGEDERLGLRVLRKPLDIDHLRRALRDILAGSDSA